MISVKELIEGRKANSPLSSFQVCGRLHTVTSYTSDYGQRGSLFLFDILTGQDSILCQVDRTYHDLQNALISIPHWTFIVLDNGVRYLQFTMDSVRRLGSTVGTLLEEKTQATQAALQLLEDSTCSNFSCIHPRQLATVVAGDIASGQQGITVAGRLSAKSVLYLRHGTEACFIVEVKDMATLYSSTSTSSFSAQPFQWVVPVVFKGDCFIKYYSELQVGRNYVFSQLQTTIMTTSTTQQQLRKVTKRSVLKFHPALSSFLELNRRQCERLLVKYNEGDSQTTSFDMDSPLDATTSPIASLAKVDTKEINLKTYTGVVTKVVDSLFGVYELDQRILLCLFHYLGYSETCPFRVGTRLTITHCHVLSLDTSSRVKVSPLLDLDWKAPWMTHLSEGDHGNDDQYEASGQHRQQRSQKSSRYILVACMRSDVRIDRFMDDGLGEYDGEAMGADSALEQADTYQRHFKYLIYTHCISRHLNFTALMRQLELFASIRMKFGNLVEQNVAYDGGDNGAASPLIWMGKRLVELVFATTGSRSTHGQGDLYGDFFQHGYSCLAVNETTNRTHKVILDSCPSLQHLISTILDSTVTNDNGESLSYKVDHAPLIEIPPSFVTSHSDVTRYCYDAKHKDTDWVIGLVDALPDGRLYFMDDTSRVALLVGNNETPMRSSAWMNMVSLGHMYVIKRFHLVVEKLTMQGAYSSSSSSSSSLSLEQRYMMCNIQDMEHLAPFTPSATNSTTLSVFLPTKKDDKLRLSHFILVDDDTMDLDLYIYNITEIMPTAMVKDEDGVVGFEKTIRVIRYGLTTRMDQYNIRTTKGFTPVLATLVFSSKMDTLSYVGNLQEGSWFGLTAMDASDEFVSHIGTKAKSDDDSTLDQPTFFVDRKKHHIYPVTQRRQYLYAQPQQQGNDDYRGNIMLVEPVYVQLPLPPLAVNMKRWEDAPVVVGVAAAIKENEPSNQQQKWDGKNDRMAIHGTLLFKGFIADSVKSYGNEHWKPNEAAKDVMLFQRLNVGVGRRGLKVFLRLRQVGGLETTDIYIGGDMHHLMYTYGVIPGNNITIFRVMRRKSARSQKIYFTACPYSYIQPHPQLGLTLFDDLLALENTEKVPTLDLARLHPCKENDRQDSDEDDDDGIGNTIFKATITIRRILKIVLQWVCTTCGTELYRAKCYGNCGKDSRRVFRAEAKVQVSDGTADVLAMIDGEALVFQLLMLLPSQKEALKQAALHHGTLASGWWLKKGNNDTHGPTDDSLRNGMTLDDLCTRARRYGRFDLYGKRYYQQRKTEASGAMMDRLALRLVTLSGQKHPVQTLSYSFVKVKVEALDLVDPQQLAWKLIDQLS